MSDDLQKYVIFIFIGIINFLGGTTNEQGYS